MRKLTLEQIMYDFHELTSRVDSNIDRTVDRLADNAEAIGHLKKATERRLERMWSRYHTLVDSLTRITDAINALSEKLYWALTERANRIYLDLRDRSHRLLSRMDAENEELRDELARANRIRDRLEDFLNKLDADEDQ